MILYDELTLTSIPNILKITRNNNKGIMLLWVMVIVFIIGFSLAFLAKCFSLYNKNVQLKYFVVKTHYLALSGINLSKQNFNDIPSCNIPLDSDDSTKVWLYNNLWQAKKYNNLDGELFLFKSANTVYSVAKCNDFRQILKANYSLDDNKIKLYKIDKL